MERFGQVRLLDVFGKGAPTANLGIRLERREFGKNVISQNYNVVLLPWPWSSIGGLINGAISQTAYREVDSLRKHNSQNRKPMHMMPIRDLPLNRTGLPE